MNEVEYNGFVAEISEDGKATIRGYWGDGGNLKIPKEIDGYPVTSVGVVFWHKDNIKSLTFPEGIVSIAGFSACFDLTNVYLPRSLERFEDYNPIDYCPAMKEVFVSPDNPRYASIDGVLFNKEKKELLYFPISHRSNSYSVPNGIKCIAEKAFADNHNLTSVSMSNSVTDIGPNAFQGCERLSKIVISESVSTIRENTFDNCKSLTEVILPNGLKEIDWRAFSRCPKLKRITIPDSVSSIKDKDDFGLIETIFSNSDPIVTVGKDSYAMNYCIKHNIKYTFPEANDWLLS